MPTLSFEGDTHNELVAKVRRWLASLDGQEEGPLSPAEAIEAGAELTKDALRIIASSAPAPIAQSDVVKALTEMGYKATEATKQTLMDGLDAVEDMTGGSVVKRARTTSRSAVYEMNAAIARQILKSLTGGR